MNFVIILYHVYYTLKQGLDLSFNELRVGANNPWAYEFQIWIAILFVERKPCYYPLPSLMGYLIVLRHFFPIEDKKICEYFFQCLVNSIRLSLQLWKVGRENILLFPTILHPSNFSLLPTPQWITLLFVKCVVLQHPKQYGTYLCCRAWRRLILFLIAGSAWSSLPFFWCLIFLIPSSFLFLKNYMGVNSVGTASAWGCMCSHPSLTVNTTTQAE